MARPRQITVEMLIPLIRTRGPVSATELAALLGVNRTTISRALPRLGGDLVTLGATRSTRYLLRRSIRNIGNRWPVYRIDENGRARDWAQLEALHDRYWWMDWAGTPPTWAEAFTESDGLWSGLPFFLQDIRPQGFLGRITAQNLASPLQLPEDPRIWSNEDILVYLQAQGQDLPGNLVVGDACLRRALSEAVDLSGSRTIAEAECRDAYVRLASEISQKLPGSSAGGEQPKFLTSLLDASETRRSVIVKFSAPIDQVVGQRWADLLICEFHAHRILADAGLATPGARLLDAGGRRFLEIPRFDRKGREGRIGIVSLEALATAGLGTLPRSWSEAALELSSRNLIDEPSLRTIRLLQSFGELIGNTDMHAGNLAFFLSDEPPFRMAPSFDMLPMLWAPGPQGELVERHFAPEPPIPSMQTVWLEAAGLAEEFWQAVASDTRLSTAFAPLANQAGDRLSILRSRST